MKIKEHKIETDFIKKLVEIKYIYRQDIKDRDSLEQNFRDKFEALNRVKLTDSEFNRLLSDDYSDKVIVTTIQKLGIALDSTNKNNYKEQLINILKSNSNLLDEKDVRTINDHIKGIYKEDELFEDATIRKCRIVQKESDIEDQDEVN